MLHTWMIQVKSEQMVPCKMKKHIRRWNNEKPGIKVIVEWGFIYNTLHNYFVFKHSLVRTDMATGGISHV